MYKPNPESLGARGLKTISLRSDLNQKRGDFALKNDLNAQNKQVVKYKFGEANVFRADCSISREPLPNGMDYVYVDDYKNGLRYFEGPQRRKRFKLKPNNEIEEIEEPLIEQKVSSENGAPKKKPKNNNGGKHNYVKVYPSKLKSLRKKLNPEIAGLCLLLTPLLEWETGFLIIGRGKRKRPAKKEDLAEELGVSISTIKRYIQKLGSFGALEFDGERFKLNAKFLAKGRAYDEDKI